MLAGVERSFDSTENEKLSSKFLELQDSVAQMCLLDSELGDGLSEKWEKEVRDCCRYIAEVKLVLSYRLELLGKSQNAASDAKQKNAKAEKLPITSPEYGKAKRDAEEATRNAEESRKKFEECSEQCKFELNYFDQTRVRDMKLYITAFAQMQLDHSLRSVDLWKNLISTLQD
jgi:hypothetical protein